MTDLTQPATAAEFEAVGVDAATAAGLAAQHNLMAGRSGTRDARIALEVSLRNLPPPSAPAPAKPISNTEGTAALAEHTDAELAKHLATAFAPPAAPYDYQFPDDRSQLSDDQITADMTVKTALHGEGMPKFVVESIAANLAQSMRTLGNESAAQAAIRQSSDRARLESMWKGESFDSNIALVDGLLEQMGNKHPVLRDVIARAAPRLTPLDVDLLLQVAKQRPDRR